MKNRRKEFRVEKGSQIKNLFSAPVVVGWNQCKPINISTSGIRVTIENRQPKIGSTLKIKMIIGERPITCKGTIMNQNGNTFGIQFVNLKEKDEKYIKTQEISTVDWR